MNVEELAGLCSEDIRRWVYFALSGDPAPPADFNWLGLAEVLAFEARTRADAGEQTRLAELAVSLYERLAALEGPEHADSHINSAIALRVYLLANRLIDPSHQSLGEGQILRHLSEVTRGSPSEAVALAKELMHKLAVGTRQLSPSDLDKMKALRKIKNQLALIKSLPPDSSLHSHGEVEPWLTIYEELP